jgi:hypothetical protein
MISESLVSGIIVTVTPEICAAAMLALFIIGY